MNWKYVFDTQKMNGTWATVSDIAADVIKTDYEFFAANGNVYFVWLDKTVRYRKTKLTVSDLV